MSELDRWEKKSKLETAAAAAAAVFGVIVSFATLVEGSGGSAVVKSSNPKGNVQSNSNKKGGK